LCDDQVFISTLTNCGGFFEKAVPYNELNRFGLIDDHKTALKCRELLEELYPDYGHAYCEVIELWRRL